MNLNELIFVAIESLRNNKLRSFLTTFGIVIGIAAVIGVVAIGKGGQTLILSELDKFGTNMFQVYPNNREGEFVTSRDFTKEDVAVIKRIVPEVKHLAPMKYYRGEIRSSAGKKSARIVGTTADYKEIRKMEMLWGRFFSESDDLVGRRVVVLEEELSYDIFGPENPVGERVMILGNPALVVGVTNKKESALPGSEPEKVAYVPISFMEGNSQWEYVSALIGSAASKDEVYRAIDRTKLILERRHNAPGHYATYNMEQEMQTTNKVTGIIGLVISCIAGISLLVGGIGLMNIMLVSVTERTREIGIRMALGARRKDILIQFLIEAVVLCSAGGIIGIIVGYGGAILGSHFLKLPPPVSWWMVLTAFLFSAVIGIFFGIYPANKASKLDPIVALRRE